MEDDDPLLTTSQAAQLGNVKTTTLAVWRHRTREAGELVGPPYVQLTPKTVRYRKSDVLRWLASRTVGAEFSPAVKSTAVAHTGPVTK